MHSETLFFINFVILYIAYHSLSNHHFRKKHRLCGFQFQYFTAIIHIIIWTVLLVILSEWMLKKNGLVHHWKENEKKKQKKIKFLIMSTKNYSVIILTTISLKTYKCILPTWTMNIPKFKTCCICKANTLNRLL